MQIAAASGSRLPKLLVLVAIFLIVTGYLTGTDVRIGFGGRPNGDKVGSNWTARTIDLPGLSIVNVHCRGRGEVALELGATGISTCPNGVPSGVELGWYLRLPGNTVVWRCSKDGGPFRYFVADAYGPHAPSGHDCP
jgi:hypothetical protein